MVYKFESGFTMKLRFRTVVSSYRSRSEYGVDEYSLDLLAALHWRKMYPRRRAGFVEEQIGNRRGNRSLTAFY